MKRSLAIILVALVLGAAIFAGSYITGQRACVVTMAGGADDLTWLREEFHLNDAEMARIRQLHENYLPQCAKMCALIMAKNTEVQSALANSTNVTAQAREKLIELGELRAQCQAHMLQYFIAVSQVMPPDEGPRYLAQMKAITLGSHQENDPSMSAGPDHGND